MLRHLAPVLWNMMLKYNVPSRIHIHAESWIALESSRSLLNVMSKCVESQDCEPKEHLKICPTILLRGEKFRSSHPPVTSSENQSISAPPSSCCGIVWNMMLKYMQPLEYITYAESCLALESSRTDSTVGYCSTRATKNFNSHDTLIRERIT